MPNSTQPAIGSAVSGQDMPTKDVTVTDRLVTFVIYCAPLDKPNPMYAFVYGKDTSLYGITDSAPYLTHLPYVVVDADSKEVLYPSPKSPKQCASFPSPHTTSALNDHVRKVHTLPPIHIPKDVKRIALHIANDAYFYRRKFQLFPWTAPDAAHSKIHIYELRSDLRSKFSSDNEITTPTYNTLTDKPNSPNEYYGYLDGDLWLDISHEFDDPDIARLCPPETITRVRLETDHIHASQKADKTGDSLQTGAGGGTSAKLPPTTKDIEQLSIDWQMTLAPIYATGRGSRSMDAFTVQIHTLGITLNFIGRALANAINTSERTTVQKALQRTSPRTFAALLKAAWKLNIDGVSLSSSWRPMLGSRLHKMGVGLDVTEIDDSAEHINLTIHNHGKADRRHPFPTTPGGKKLARLYQELNADSEVMSGAVYTPWVNWVEPHDTHMHITVNDE